MESSEPVPPSSTEAPISSAPSSRGLKWPINEIADELRTLTVLELSEVQRFMKRIHAARGECASPELVSQVVATVWRLGLTFSARVPISLVRANMPNVPRTLLDKALFESEKRHILQLEPLNLPEAFVEISAAIQDKRGLLYWIVPFNPIKGGVNVEAKITK
jgi:hypothetical protein